MNLNRVYRIFKKHFAVEASCQLIDTNANVNERLANNSFSRIHIITFKNNNYYAKYIFTGLMVLINDIKQCYCEYMMKFPISVNIFVGMEGGPGKLYPMGWTKWDVKIPGTGNEISMLDHCVILALQ